MRSNPTPPQRNKSPFFPENIYHIFNRTNNKETLFEDDADRLYFLSQYKQYVGQYVNTFAYCLMDNHFHIMAQVKTCEEIQAAFENLPKPELTQPQLHWLSHTDEPKNVHKVVERQFTRLFIAYSMTFNLKYQRNGNLFYRPFKHVCVKNEKHMLHLVWYIHLNPQKHGVWHPFSTYRWSSYNTLLSDRPTMIQRAVVHNMFDGREGFLDYHQNQNIEHPKDLDDFLEP